MLLKISTTHKPASNLSYLLHKHPDRLQTVKIPFGTAHIFYPEAKDELYTVALLLEMDAIEMVRNRKKGLNHQFKLGQYVNDRPYVASSFMSVAIAKAFSSALNGTCQKKPDIVDEIMSFTASLSVVAAPKGGELLIRKLFEPLGYQVTVKGYQLDEKFTDWGESKYYTLTLTINTTLQMLLSHLYVLIPVLDHDKHYWMDDSEIEKLLSKGKEWLKDHPEKEQIVRRYFKNAGSLSRQALNQLVEEKHVENHLIPILQKKESLHEIRLKAVLAELKSKDLKTVMDLGCGEGKFLKLLLKEKQFTKILGMDISYKSLESASEKIYYREMSPKQKERIELIQGALTYKDDRLTGFDAAVLIEVIEHLDQDRLQSFEKVLFKIARPETIILTTPNREYNKMYENLSEDSLRHDDHRFEWTRTEFKQWANNITEIFDYEVLIKPLGPIDEQVGSPSQMAIFNKNGKCKSK